MREIWKPIPTWAKYEVSNLGRVRRLAGKDAKNRYFVPGKILKPVPVQSGSDPKYRPLNVTLSDSEARCVGYKIAFLVLTAFRGPPPSKLENCVRHIDDDQTNNKLTNLCWGSQGDNAKDRIRNGRVPRGQENGNSRYKEEQVKLVIRTARKFSGHGAVMKVSKITGMKYDAVWSILRGKAWNHIER